MSTLIRDCKYRIVSEYQPFALIRERDAWNELPPQLLEALHEQGNAFFNYEYPHILATDFMAFSRTGNRTDFEELYFAKRRALNALVLAEGASHNGAYMDDIINGIYSICEEPAWQLPAHNSYIRDTPQLLLPDVTAPVLDLFACETGALLAMIYYLMHEELDQISPFITVLISQKIHERIIEPYLHRHFWWMGNEEEPMCNWTIWCTQNILLTAFLTPQDASVRDNIMKQACYSIDCFLKDYGEDGCCEEGAQYYRHAGLCLLGALDIMNTVTNDAFSHLYQHDKIKNIASYILNVHISGPYYANFADCSPIAGRAGVREFLFGKRTRNEDLMLFAASDYAESDENDRLLTSEINLFYRLQNVFTYAEITEHYQKALLTCQKRGLSKPVPQHRDLYYESIGLFLVRDEEWALAVKAGCNDDSHNHNDTGSLIVYRNGNPFLIDVGVESYTKKTFSPDRYDIWTMQSAYHNLPTFVRSETSAKHFEPSKKAVHPNHTCGHLSATSMPPLQIMQSAGADFKAQIQDVSICPGGVSSITMDLAKCYPAEALLTSYIRQVTLTPEQGIMIHDIYDGTLDCFISLMLYEQPVITDQVIQVGTLGTITIPKGCTCITECIPITDTRLKTTWKHDIYRILLYPVKHKCLIHILP